MRVSLIGWDVVPRLAPACSVTSHDEVDLAGVLRSESLVVVLGGRAAGAVDPTEHLEDLDAFGGVTLVVPHPDLLRAAVRWCSLGAATLMPAGGVTSYVEHVRLTRPMRRLSLREWLGESRRRMAPSSLAALRVLPRLRRFVTTEWCAAIGATRRGLDQLAAREFHHSPGAVLRDYRLRSALALRAAGHRLDDIALSLGYSDKTTLSRALRNFVGSGSVLQGCTELPTLPG